MKTTDNDTKQTYTDEAAGNPGAEADILAANGENISKAPVWVDMLAIVGVLLVSQLACLILTGLLGKATGISKEIVGLINYTLSMGVTVIFALWLRNKRGYGKPVLRFTLKKTNPTLILWGLILIIATSIVLEPLLELFPSELLDALAGAIGKGGWAMIMTVVCAPVLEEILFRGIIQECVTRRYGGVRGVLAAAAIFGLVHFIPQQAINAFFVGIVLGYIYIKTKSLIPVMIIHALNNAIAFLLMAVFGGAGILTRDVVGNATVYWILYGVCALVVVLAAGNVYKHLRNEPRQVRA